MARSRGSGQNPLVLSSNPKRHAGSCLAVAAGTVLIALCWQSLTVRFNRNGNWTALYATGAKQPIPPALLGEDVYRFTDTGFDGQFYHYIAHDPFVGPETVRYIDDARLRYRRILVPALAHALALGRSRWIDGAFLLVIHLALFAGSLGVARLARGRGRSPLWGVCFLLVPAVVSSIDRLTVDIALAALCVWFVRWADGPPWRLSIVLLLAPLVRETGLLLVAAAALAALLGGRHRRAVLFASAALPALAWWAFVHARTAAQDYPLSLVPLSGILTALTHPMAYAGKPALIARLNQGADALALAGMLAALVLAWRPLRSREHGPVAIAGMLFAAMGVAVQRLDHWQHVFDFGRMYSPLLIVLAAGWLESRRAADVAPTLLMQPRIVLQLGSQIVGVLLGVLRTLGLGR
jgi:hypothetical protein